MLLKTTRSENLLLGDNDNKFIGGGSDNKNLSKSKNSKNIKSRIQAHIRPMEKLIFLIAIARETLNQLS